MTESEVLTLSTSLTKAFVKILEELKEAKLDTDARNDTAKTIFTEMIRKVELASS